MILLALVACSSPLAPWWFGPGAVLLVLGAWCYGLAWLLDDLACRLRRRRAE